MVVVQHLGNMDILYIVGKNLSKCDNFELRASLRSISKYGKNINKIYVVGYCPEWLSDEVIKIPKDLIYENPSTQHEKHINIADALLHAIDNSDIGDEFLVSSDDHIYVRDVDFDNYPVYVRKSSYGEGGEKNHLPSSAKENDSDYKKFLVDTNNLCSKYGISNLFFCLHRNMHVSRKIVQECREIFEAMIQEGHIAEPWAFLNNWRQFNYGGEIVTVKDIKLNGGSEWYKTDSRETEVFSTCDFNKNSGLYVLINGLFPDKCKYEKEVNNE